MNLKQTYIISAILALVLLVYYPAIFSPPCLVDDYELFNSLTGRSYHLLDIFLPRNVGYYRPLLDLTYYLEDRLWMLEESFLHLDNVLLHIANVLLVYMITMQISRILYDRSSRGVAVSAAILFAVHPINTESVNWISGRSDLLAGVFLFLSMYLLFRSLERTNMKLLAVSTLSLFTACMAKETALFAYPGLLFFVYTYDLQRVLIPQPVKNGEMVEESILNKLKSRGKQLGISFIARRYYYLALSIVPVLYLLLRKLASLTVDRGMNKLVNTITSQEQGQSITISLFKSLQAMGFYLKKIFVPWPLNFNIVEVSSGYFYIGILLIILLVWLLWRQSLITALFVCGICICSSAIFVAIGGLAWTPFAERYMYIPSALFAIGMVFLAHELILRYKLERKALSFALLMIGILSVSTVQRNLVWMDELKLYEDSLEKAPNFLRAWRNYAAALYRAGRENEAKKIHNILGKIKNRKDGLEVQRAFSSFKGL